MKIFILLGLLDVIVGVIIGYFGYNILNHKADVVDWCIIVICVVILLVRLYAIIKDAIKATNKDK